MHFNTLSAILRGYWLIDRSFVQSHLPIIAGIITGKGNGAELFSGAGDFEQPFAYNNGARYPAYKYVWDPNSTSYQPQFNEDIFPDDSLFVIPSIGPVTKYNGDCGEPGNVKRQSWAGDFANSNKLTGLISYLDTPGGQADGTPQYADYIKSIDKPKCAFVDGGAYSAGAWNASAHDAIYLSGDFSGFGSIGAYTTIVDFSGYFKKMGIKVTDLYPDISSEKNIEYREALKGNTDLMLENITELAQYFIDAFGQNRAGKLKNNSWEKGKAFNAQEALSIGLVDGIAGFDDVAASMGYQTKAPGKKIISTPARKTSIQSHSDMKYPKLTALLTALEGGAAFTQEELDAANAELSEAGITGVGLFPEQLATDAAEASAEVTRLTSELGIANTNIQTLNGTVTTLTTENGTLKTKLSKAPAAAAPIVGQRDPVTEETAEQKGAKIIAAMPHNVGLSTNPLFAKLN